MKIINDTASISEYFADLEASAFIFRQIDAIFLLRKPEK